MGLALLNKVLNKIKEISNNLNKFVGLKKCANHPWNVTRIETHILVIKKGILMSIHREFIRVRLY